MKLSNRMLNWIIIGYLLFVIIVLTASINPIVRLNKIKVLEIRLDYVLHFLLFIPWMILARWRWMRSSADKTVLLMAFSAGLFLSVISEVIQIFVPNRSFSLSDFAANSLGIAFGVVIAGWGRTKTVAGSQQEEVDSSQ